MVVATRSYYPPRGRCPPLRDNVWVFFKCLIRLLVEVLVQVLVRVLAPSLAACLAGCRVVRETPFLEPVLARPRKCTSDRAGESLFFMPHAAVVSVVAEA